MIIIGPTGDSTDNDSVCKKYRTDNKILFPLISVEGNSLKIKKDYKVTINPALFLIAPNKKIVEKDIWPYEEMEAILAKYKIDTSAVRIDMAKHNKKMFFSANNSLKIFSLNGVQIQEFCGYPVTDKSKLTWNSHLAGGIYLLTSAEKSPRLNVTADQR